MDWFFSLFGIWDQLHSALAPLIGKGDPQNAERVYVLLAFFRAILGVGVGGKCT